MILPMRLMRSWPLCMATFATVEHIKPTSAAVYFLVEWNVVIYCKSKTSSVNSNPLPNHPLKIVFGQSLVLQHMRTQGSCWKCITILPKAGRLIGPSKRPFWKEIPMKKAAVSCYFLLRKRRFDPTRQILLSKRRLLLL